MHKMKSQFIRFAVFTTLISLYYCSFSFESVFNDVTVLVPLDMDALGTQIYVTSLTGQVISFSESDSSNSQVFFDFSLSTSPGVSFYSSVFIGGQDGLASIEFHPNYPSVPKFYAYHSASPSSIQLTAWSVHNGEVNYSSGEVLLEFNKIDTFVEIRYGGDLKFDGAGDLFISTGDTSNTTSSQDPHSYLGKILRITPYTFGPGYSIPNSNPYVHKTSEGLAEIYAIGFRNPRKILFPTKESNLLVGENGELIDGIQEIKAGDNAGWDYLDGCEFTVENPPKDRYTFPFFYFAGDEGLNSLTLGPFYTRTEKKSEFSQLQNTILFADLFTGTLYSLPYNTISRTCAHNIERTLAQAPGVFISAILNVGENIYISDAFAAFYGGPSFHQLVISA